MPVYRSPPTLTGFLGSNAFIRVIKGPFGSGKSSGCVVELARRALEQKPGPDGIRRTRFAVVRNTYRELEDTTRRTFENWVKAPSYGRWSESDFIFNFRARGIESEFIFRALDRPSDVGKLLSLELTGAYINELRELPKEIFDALQGRVGRYPAKMDGGATWKGIWADTNPWPAGHWGKTLFERPGPKFAKAAIAGLPREGMRLTHEKGAVFELYTQPGGLDADAENVANLDSDYYSILCAGKDEDFVNAYVHGKDPSAAVGSIYGELIARLEEAGGISDFFHGPDEVFTNWDLGRSDSTAIWFWRIVGRDRVEIIDHYENHLKELSHYFDVVESRGYRYVKHWLPHDAAAKRLGAEISVEEQCRERWPGLVEIGPNLSVADGIAAARWLLEGRARFHERTREGVDLLRGYRREWDPDARAFSDRPVHDFCSHTADAFRYLAVVAKVSELITRKPAPKARAVAVQQPTLDEIFREHDIESERPERI